MQISYCKYNLQFKHPFGLSHSTRTHTPVVYLKLEHNHLAGFGEAALPPYLGETQDSVIGFFRKAATLLETNPPDPFRLMPLIDRISEGNTAAKAAIDMALFDLSGKLHQKPVYELLSFPEPVPKATSVTIAIGDLELIPKKLEELTDFHVIKVKLGNTYDKEIIAEIRKFSDKPLAVDVNQGWNDKVFALEMIKWLADRNTLYVEQPLGKSTLGDSQWISEKSPIPVLADESFQRLTDLHRISSAFTGINLKLMKCTGLMEGARILNQAKQLGIKVNIGCMSESSCGISAASQLLSAADWIDLDGPMLITNDPFAGISFKEGLLHTANAPGTGCALKINSLAFSLL